MRLIECYIDNFGKISKEKFSFTGGLNCIKEDNGSGKTTLAVFIKVMLYGMSDTKKTSLEENDRKHYLPWSGGVCGGSLSFALNGKIYRIERTFAPKAADDTMEVYDSSLGRVTDELGDVPGETIFGIDADGFERTVFLSERSLSPKSNNKSISAKLSDLLGCDGDIGGMDDAMKALEEQRKFYHKKGGSGELSDTKERINEIQRRLEDLLHTEVAIEGAEGKMRLLSSKIEKAKANSRDLMQKRQDAMLKMADNSNKKRADDLKIELEKATAKKDELSLIFGYKIPSFKEIDEASYKMNTAKKLINSINSPENKENDAMAKFDGKVREDEIKKVRSALMTLRLAEENENRYEFKRARKILQNRTPSIEEIDEIEAVVKEKAKIKPLFIALYIIFALAILVGGVLLQPIIAIAATILCLLSVVADIISRANYKRAKVNKISDFIKSVSGVSATDKDECLMRLADMRSAVITIQSGAIENREELLDLIYDLVRRFPEYIQSDVVASATEIINEYDKCSFKSVAIKMIMSSLGDKEERATILMREAESFLARFKTKTDDPFTELREALTEYNLITKEILAKRDELEKLQSRLAIGEDNRRVAASEIESIDRMIQENDNSLAELSREYTLVERSYRQYLNELEMSDELNMRKAELEEILEKHKDNYDTILLTKKYITMAKDNMTAKYLGKTKDGFLKYTEIIGGITGESFEMDTDFGITKQEGGSTKSVEAYSRGTRDLFNLASRLALVDSLYEGEKPFIILDDPFTAFDDKKTAAALKLLSEFAKEKQIIYFTCSKARSV